MSFVCSSVLFQCLWKQILWIYVLHRCEYIHKYTGTDTCFTQACIFVLGAQFSFLRMHFNQTVPFVVNQKGLTFTIRAGSPRSVIFHFHCTLCPKVCDQHYSQSTSHDLYIYMIQEQQQMNTWILTSDPCLWSDITHRKRSFKQTLNRYWIESDLDDILGKKKSLLYNAADENTHNHCTYHSFC